MNTSTAPRSPHHPFNADKTDPKANVRHYGGEIWCVTLWDARANFIKKYGFSAGNEMILKLVTDGINLAPQNPTFIEARDAILTADQVRYAGANKPELWAAFAKRGLGQGASIQDNTFDPLPRC